MFFPPVQFRSRPRHGRPAFPARRSRVRGFTLVEVTLALGIIAFAFVSIFGLLPLGLNISREAVDTTITSQIVQRMTTEAQQTDYSKLAGLSTIFPGVSSPDATTPVQYFDDQGNATDAKGAVYQAGFVVDAGNSPSGLQPTPLPGSASTDRLAAVKICILNLTANRTSQEPDPTKNPDWRRIVVHVPDNGR